LNAERGTFEPGGRQLTPETDFIFYKLLNEKCTGGIQPFT
jgi:hypothetical protein